MKLKNLIGSFHNHSTYSLIDAVSTPTEMVKFHAEQGTKWVGLTDHGHLSGLYELEQAAEKYNIQHIAACEFYVLIPELETYGHLTTLAYNDVGKKNLLTLYNKSWDSLSKAKWGKKKPQITWELLEKYREGLFVGTGCLVSVLGRCVTNNRMDLAEANLAKLIEIFGKDKVFAEIIPHKVDRDYNHKTGLFEPNPCQPWCPDGDLQKGYLLWLWDHAVIQRKLKPVLTTDAHFTTPDKKKIQDAILMNGESGWHFDRCFEGNSLVNMADGSLKKIKDIKTNDLVLTFNFDSGKIEPAKVLNIFKNKSKKEEFGFYKCYGSNSQRIKKNIIATKDHKIWSNGSWKEISKTNSGSLLYEGFTSTVKNILIGTLLGDGCIVKTGRNKDIAYYSYGHAEDQKELIDIISKLICGKIYKSHANRSDRQSFFRTTSANAEFKNMYDDFYKNSEKIVPEDLILYPETLAWWFMDDGTVCKNKNRTDFPHLIRKAATEQYRLYTNNFHVRYVDLLIKKIANLGIFGSKYPSKHSKGTDYGYFIIFNKSEGKKISQLIKQWIPKSLQYKLHQEERCEDNNLIDYSNLESKEFKITPTLLKTCSETKYNYDSANRKTSKNNFEWKYDIEVENHHCYFVNNLLVHNSHHILTPEEMYHGVTYLPGHNEALHDEMVDNAVFFCENVKYSKTEKKIHLAFKFNNQAEALQAFADNILEDRVNKICECHGNYVGKITGTT